MDTDSLERFEKAILRMLEKSEASLERRLKKIEESRKADREEFAARHREINATLKEVAEDLKANVDAQNQADIRRENMYAEIGGLGNSLGSLAEDFFYGNAPAAIEKDPRFKKKFSYKRNVSGKSDREYDIVGINGDCVIVIEVKSMLKGNDFGEFKRLLPHFVKDFPEHKGKKIYGAFATMSLNHKDAKRIQKKIEDSGLLLLTQAGSHAAGVFKPDKGHTDLKDFGKSISPV